MSELKVPSKAQLNVLKDHYHNRRYDDAEKLAKSITEQFPKHQFSWKLLGTLFRQKGMHTESLLVNQTAVKLIPQDAGAHNNLALAFKELGKFQEAEVSLREAIALKPDFAEAHINLAIALKKMGNLQEAEAILRQAIAIKPNSVEAYGSLGIIAYINGDLESAIVNIEKANAIDPKSKPTKFLLSAFRSAKLFQKSRFYKDNTSNLTSRAGLIINPLILNRTVEADLVSILHKMNSREFEQTTVNDARYGNGRCSLDFNFFRESHPIIKTVSEDLTRIMMEAVESEIYIYDSFFNILSAGSGTAPHDHINGLDKELGFVNQKYSLVYYLSVGDQDCSQPGILKLHNPAEEIVPSEGMITIIPAARKHSAVYNGKKDRIMIGVNFYSF